MKRYKFQALATPYPDQNAREKLSSGSHRMVLRADSSETHRSQVFSALANATSGPEIGTIAADLLALVADQEPRPDPDGWHAG